MKLWTRTLTAIAVAALLGPATSAVAQTYEVTITNLTYQQILSPPVVATHSGAFRVFRAGEEATPELAALAEDADSAGLIALLQTSPGVEDVAIGSGVILPGESATVYVQGSGRRAVTALGMLVTTNDAFFSGTARVVGRSASVDAPAYDAGSEQNTNDCAHIPGPPCGNAGVRVTDGAEGFIHIHRGIHDGGTLDPAVSDWRNPVARISVRRLTN